MGKIIILSFCLLFSNFLYSQTTEEEYLYVTYGYNEQLDKGLDNKKGYSWKPLTEYKFTNNEGRLVWKKSKNSKFEFEGLYRTNEDAPCAIVAIYKEKESNKKKDGIFICLPHPNSRQEVLKKAEIYFEEEIAFKSNVLKYYSLALSKLALHLSQKSK